jgi:hypothetical protein
MGRKCGRRLPEGPFGNSGRRPRNSKIYRIRELFTEALVVATVARLSGSTYLSSRGRR